MKNTLIDYLNISATKYTDKPAFIGEDESINFKELSQNTDSIASFLADKNIYKKPVVIFMKKSPHMVNTFFGVIKAGCFYVPLDESMPLNRIQSIIDTAGAEHIICDIFTRKQCMDLSIREVFLYDDLIGFPINKDALDVIDEKRIDTDPVYIVFTSGSTGTPKGVVACHRSVVDYINNLSDVLGLNENTVFGNQSPLYFDACLKEIYPTLMFGATTYLIPQQLFSTPIKLVEYLNENKINTICWVVSALVMISAFDTFSSDCPKYLKTIAFGSEVFPIKQYRIWRKALPDTEFFNLYGPTEATGMSCYYKCSADIREDEYIPIGRPFDNTQILLVDNQNEVAREATEGEIYIRGTCVTLGYFRDKENTDKSFVQNPLHNDYTDIVYKTGDMAKYDNDGNLVFISRKDYQIKHMGHRIELGEIEAMASHVENIGVCCCVYDDKKDMIVLFYNGTVQAKDISLSLKAGLPRYMLPNRIRNIENMPFTPNGKIDRKKLKEMV